MNLNLYNFHNINPYIILSISYFMIAFIYFIHAGLNIKHKFITYLQNNHNLLLYVTGCVYIIISITYLYSYHNYTKHKHNISIKKS
jgi:hypothetical protein